MLRAMAKQAEAEREKRAKIIHAEGEFAAAQRLTRGRTRARQGTHHHAVAVLADVDRDRRGKEHDHRLPVAYRHSPRVRQDDGENIANRSITTPNHPPPKKTLRIGPETVTPPPPPRVPQK